jgi:hypothetical protein
MILQSSLYFDIFQHDFAVFKELTPIKANWITLINFVASSKRVASTG